MGKRRKGRKAQEGSSFESLGFFKTSDITKKIALQYRANIKNEQAF